jgi:site-specific DNA-methyltransferase (adenine-specific)
MTNVHFMSITNEWSTPPEVYAGLDEEFGFNYDPCPLSDLDESLVSDGLLNEWGTVSFCNPPYSKIKEWVRKGYLEWKKGKTVVFLIPSRTDTGWWHDYVMEANEIRFIRGRLRFGGSQNSAPFPSCVVVFRGA